MPKHTHEIRDPIHIFVRLDSDERNVLNSEPFQRLRHVHQLSLSYLVYPGATHRRFEHSLGVMELAARVFDIVTHRDNVHPEVLKLLPEIAQPNQLQYWRRVLRMAALCHDVGHLPFSHAAEAELLPEGWNHERLTRKLIEEGPLGPIFDSMTPPLRHPDVVKLAVGPKNARGLKYSTWEAILAEIIVGDAFGVDRIDYLLRDSYHAGVIYGRFDHYRLIDTLRILPASPIETEGTNNNSGETSEAQNEGASQHDESDDQPAPREPLLGVEQGGLHSAEALMLARFFMFSQVYFHPVRRIYDVHLKDFLAAWLTGGRFSTDVGEHLKITDNEVTAALLAAARNPSAVGHESASRIVRRDHFRLLYQRHPDDVAINPESGEAIYSAACEKFGADRVRRDRYRQKSGALEFPVLTKDGRIASSFAMSQTLRLVEPISVDYVFVDSSILGEAQSWLESDRVPIITPKEGDDNE